MGIEGSKDLEIQNVPSERDDLLLELGHAWSPGIPHDGEGNVTDIPTSWDKATDSWRKAWEVNVYGYRATHTDGNGKATKLELRGGRLYDEHGRKASLDLIKDLTRVLREASG
jgi:hypothetical protein